eukprot:COSAG05_NODE_3672_length_1915_cov_1.610132_3_plen_102_part_00
MIKTAGGHGHESAAPRLPSLRQAAPREKVLRQLELRELQAEVRELQRESNLLRGESANKQAQYSAMLEGVKAEQLSGPGRQKATPSYLQVCQPHILRTCGQ